jgi:ketosteroid isomerase-like protein
MTDLDQVLQRLQRLEDIETARGIYHRYAHVLDEPDAVAVARLFTEDGLLHTPMGTSEGREAIESFFRSAFEADTSVKRHFIVNPRVVDVTAGVVRLQSYFLYTGRGDDTSVIGWGEYDDRVDVRGAEPLFAEKTIAVHVGTDLASGWAKESV